MDRLKEMLKQEQSNISSVPSGDSVTAPSGKKKTLQDLKQILASPVSSPAIGQPVAPLNQQTIDYIEVQAFNIEEALETASEHFNVAISDLEYEIIEHGKPGFLGVGRKPSRFSIKPSLSAQQALSSELADVVGMTLTPDAHIAPIEPVDSNGEVKIKILRSGIYIIVTKPKGNGRPVSENEVRQLLSARELDSVDMNAVIAAINRPQGKKVKIGEWTANPDNDSTASVELSDDEMHAYVSIVQPRKSGRSLEYNDIVAYLNDEGVTYGIQDDKVAQLLDDEIYNQPFEVATGDKPEHGEDARIEYKFRTGAEKHRPTVKDGERVDYHDLDIVENVTAGQLLAIKVLATMGEPGRTVTNKRLEAREGKDIPFAGGRNTKLSDDGLKLYAEINGQVSITKGIINVEPIYEVKGDVGLETGNITFVGTVLVRGNVEDGFSIKAAGNIDIRGTVGKAHLEAEGDVIIKQGLAGKDEAVIIAGGNIHAKFIEHAKKVESGQDIIIIAGIMHSSVDAAARVICHGGRRAMIVGGRVRAGEEVNAKQIGSPSYTETEIEVGFDPKTRQNLTDLEKERNAGKEKMHELAVNINTLESHKRGGAGITEDREELLQQMKEEKVQLEERLFEVEEQIAELKSYLNVLEERGKVCVQDVVHPGTKITVKNAFLNVRDNFKYVSFIQEGGNIKVLPYEEPKL